MPVIVSILLLCTTMDYWISISFPQGKMFDMDDKRMKEFDKLLEDLNAATFALGVRDFFPGLKYLPKFVQNRVFGLDRLEEFKEKFFIYFDVSSKSRER